jgi:ERCC4-type nuclease
MISATEHWGSLAPPTIVIDTRERAPIAFKRFPTVRRALQTGDYSVRGCELTFAIERKTIDDMAQCCAGRPRERFERALHRLRGFRFKRLLIVGLRDQILQHRYRSGVSPKAILHSLAAWEIRFDTPIVWCVDAEEAGRRIESYAWWYSREILHQSRQLTA